MMVGLFCTLIPRLPGTLIILSGSLLYGMAFGWKNYHSSIVFSLVLLVLLAEVGGRLLRIYLTQSATVSRAFSTDTTIGNAAGLIASDALFGTVFGTLLWEMVAGKTLLPRVNTVVKVLSRLMAAAALRFVCGLLMIFIVMIYIF